MLCVMNVVNLVSQINPGVLFYETHAICKLLLVFFLLFLFFPFFFFVPKKMENGTHMLFMDEL
jgi:hypothetical protein